MPRILVVDHDPQVRQLLIKVLRQHGHEVTTAQDGLVCLRHLLNEPHDLVMIDVALPVVSGPELVRIIRETGWVLPILMLTELPLSADVDEVAIQGLIAKPLDPNTVNAAVEEAIRAAPERRRAARIPWVVPVKMTDAEGNALSAWTTDISPGGLCVNWEEPVPVEQVRRVTRIEFIDPPQQGIEIPLQPVRSLDGPQTGFLFLIRHHEDVTLLGRLLATIS